MAVAVDQIKVEISYWDAVDMLEQCSMARHALADLGAPIDEIDEVSALEQRIKDAIKAATGE